MTVEKNVPHCVANYFKELRAMDEDGWTANFAHDGALYDPADAAPLMGESALRGFFQAACGAFKSLALAEEAVFVCGNQAAVKFRGEGVGKNGRAVRFEGIDLFDISADGRIQSVRGYWDPAGLFAQLQSL